MYRQSTAAHWIVACVALGSAGCLGSPGTEDDFQFRGDQDQNTEGTDELAAPPEQATQVEEDGFWHPLMAAPEVDGKYAGVDFQKTPNGDRYAIQDSIIVDEDGDETVFSGVAPISTQELDLGPPAKDPAAKPVIDERLQAQVDEDLEGNEADAVHRVLVWAKAPRVRIQENLEAGLAKGEISSKAEWDAARASEVETRKSVLKPIVDDLASAAEASGGLVIGRCKAMPCVTAAVPAGEIAGLAENPAVLRISADGPIKEEGADGITSSQGMQIDQFFPDYEGQSEVIYAAIIENYPLNTYFDFLALGKYGTFFDLARMQANRECDASDCQANQFPCASDFSNCTGSAHPARVASIMVGDITKGQHRSIDTNNTYTTAQKQRSGYGRRAWLYAYNAYDQSNQAGAVQNAIDDVGQRDPSPALVNMSLGFGLGSSCSELSTWDDCAGDTALSMAVNELFEQGILFIKSAGNDGTACGSSVCSVTVPGSALSAFTVGASSTQTNCPTVSSVRAAGVWGSSARGGTATQGGGRTIVDLLAYGERRLLGDQYNAFSPTTCSFVSGTSYAAPAVAGAAIDVIDHYHEVHGTLIDNPGVLAANLLLMGDRYTPSGDISVGYSRHSGAGRLKARKRDGPGMDSPWQWATGIPCVGHSEANLLYLNSGNLVPTGADVVKGVVWWYDPRHDQTGELANIDLELVELDSQLQVVGVLAESDSTDDNKERVFYEYTGAAKRMAFRVVGTNVDFDQGEGTCPGAPNEDLRYYYAFFYEDSARGSDFDGPEYTNGIGVEPED